MRRLFFDEKLYGLILVLLACCFQSSPLKAQDTVFLKKKTAFYINDSLYKSKRDTTFVLKPNQKFLPLNSDSVFYKKLGKSANKSRLLEELLGMALSQTSSSSPASGDLTDESKNWTDYQGLIISDIIIKQPPIGEFSFADSSLYPNTMADIIQLFHIYTKPEVIKKNLYIKKGDTINPWAVADNEKYIRDLSFIENARFYPSRVTNDSIELLLIVQDKLPYGVFPIIHSAKKQSLKIRNTNFLGYGNEVGINFSHENGQRPEFYLSGLHFKFNNFKKQFLQSNVGYSRSSSEEHLDLEIGRNYLAGAYKLAGNVSLSYNYTHLPHWLTPGDDFIETATYFDGNIWAGYQIELEKKHRMSDRPAYIFPAVAVYNHYHIDRPFASPDSNLFLSDQTSFYASLSLLSQDFVSTEMLLAQGLKQTLPVGLGLTFTGGYLLSEFYKLPYFGIRGIYAKRTNRLGYLLASFKLGSFVHEQSMRQGALVSSVHHLGRVMESGDYGFRIFTGIKYTLGINRETYDSLFLNNSSGITGMSTNKLKGFQRVNVELEAIVYTPWRWIGFYFTPYFIAEAGLIGKPDRSILKNRFISSFGVGIRLRNDFLVFSSIQLRILYYPYTPSGVANWSIDLSDQIEFESFDFNPGAPDQVQFK